MKRIVTSTSFNGDFSLFYEKLGQTRVKQQLVALCILDLIKRGLYDVVSLMQPPLMGSFAIINVE